MESDEFEMKIIVDENISINCKMQKEMNISDFEAVVMRAKALSKASGYTNVIGLKSGGRLGTPKKFWNESEIEDLKKLWGKVPLEKLEDKFGRSMIAITYKATSVGLPREYQKYKTNKDLRKNKFWNSEQIKQLKELHSKGVDPKEIGSKLGFKRRQVYDKIKNMKAKRSW